MMEQKKTINQAEYVVGQLTQQISQLLVQLSMKDFEIETLRAQLEKPCCGECEESHCE